MPMSGSRRFDPVESKNREGFPSRQMRCVTFEIVNERAGKGAGIFVSSIFKSRVCLIAKKRIKNILQFAVTKATPRLNGDAWSFVQVNVENRSFWHALGKINLKIISLCIPSNFSKNRSVKERETCSHRALLYSKH